MKIYTSYFGNRRNFRDLVPISIALYTPIYFKARRYNILSPSPEILSLKDNEELYTKKFNDALKSINPMSVFETLEELSHRRDIVLLCYEKPPQFCHRHLVAEWLEKELGIKVEEL